jgi:beta-lactamase regulating signal transducer with metallopeptidase domain
MNHTIAHLFSDHLVTALSRTLMHSLWQGALLSVVTGLIMTFTRKTSSALRYNLLVAALALFAVVVTGTLVMEFNQDATRAPVAAGSYSADARSAPAGTTVYPAAASLSVTEIIGAYLNRYAAVIVWIWLLVVCARCVQFTAGLNDVYKLRRKDLFRIDRYWEERLRQLGLQVGIKRWVGIFESGRTKTPMVTGYLKPLILVPIGMLASLSAEEAEAILLHELAHIRRADYLVNLMQNLLEIVLFFNPPVLWLSALIKAERENCCDDMVLARSSKVNYLKALLACEEYNQPSPAYAMALKGSNGGLKNRVARIISNKNLSLSGKEKSLLAACLIATGIFTAAFTNGVELNHQVTAASKTTQANFKSDAEKTRSIISDMMQDGIITSANDLSFKIGRDEFVVNYQKQPEEINQKYRAKYVGDQPDGDRIWYYGFDKDKYKPAGNNYKASAVAKTDSDRVKNIISNMVNDGIITSLDGLSFKIGTDEFVVNYQKQPDAVYQKYRVKYVATQYSGSEDWIWYYNFDTPKWALIVAHKYKVEENTNHTQPDNATTGVFQGKLN